MFGVPNMLITMHIAAVARNIWPILWPNFDDRRIDGTTTTRNPATSGTQNPALEIYRSKLARDSLRDVIAEAVLKNCSASAIIPASALRAPRLFYRIKQCCRS
jgi:hypothetical protein